MSDEQFKKDIQTLDLAADWHMTCEEKEAWMRIREHLTAPPAVPEGYALVPVEPTEAMLEAGEVALEEWWGGKTQEPSFAVVYRAMLAAAQAKGD